MPVHQEAAGAYITMPQNLLHMPCLDLAQCGLPACPDFLPRPHVPVSCCFLDGLGSAGGLPILPVEVMLRAEAPHAVHVARRGMAFLAVHWVPIPTFAGVT